MLTYLIDQSSVIVDFLQFSPGTDLKNDPIAILVLSCVVISQYKAFIPPHFFSKFDYDYNVLHLGCASRLVENPYFVGNFSQ